MNVLTYNAADNTNLLRKQHRIKTYGKYPDLYININVARRAIQTRTKTETTTMTKENKSVSWLKDNAAGIIAIVAIAGIGIPILITTTQNSTSITYIEENIKGLDSLTVNQAVMQVKMKHMQDGIDKIKDDINGIDDKLDAILIRLGPTE